MKKQMEDKLRMGLASQQAMNDHTDLWNGIPAMVTAKASLDTKLTSIKGVRNTQEQNTTGVAADMGGKKELAIDAALVVIGGLKAFANATDNRTLLKKIDYSPSVLARARNTTLAEQLKIVRDEATPLLRVLAPYNITDVEVNALNTAIVEYEFMISKPRVALNVRKNATGTIASLLQEMDGSLKIIDGLMSTLQQTQPEFFQIYHNARMIVDSSSGGTGVSGMVKDKTTGAPLGGVEVSINAPVHKTRVNARSATRRMRSMTSDTGRYEMRRLAAGDYTVTLEKEGYHSLSIQVSIKDTGIASADGEMERVSPPAPSH